MRHGLEHCAVACIRHEHCSADILSQAFAVLPKDAGIVVIRDNPAQKRYEFLFASKEFPETMSITKKHLDFPMIKFNLDAGKFVGYEVVTGTPPSRAKN